MWLTYVYMSGEQITNTSVETQITEDDLHLLESSPSKTKKRVDINDLLSKVRLAQKKERMESTIFFGLVTVVIIVTGLIVSI